MTQSNEAVLDSQSILASIRRRGRKGMSLAMLAAEVNDERGLGRSDARRVLHGVLKELERQGEIVLGRGKRYFPAEVSDLHPGLYRRMTGGGFVVDVDGDDGGPVWVAPSGRRGALHGDRVLIRFETPHKRARLLGFREGVVIRVVEKRTTEVVGVWVADGGPPYVRPLGRGQKFTVEVSSSKVEGEPSEGELVAVSVDHVEGRGRVARGLGSPRLR